MACPCGQTKFYPSGFYAIDGRCVDREMVCRGYLFCNPNASGVDPQLVDSVCLRNDNNNCMQCKYFG